MLKKEMFNGTDDEKFIEIWKSMQPKGGDKTLLKLSGEYISYEIEQIVKLYYFAEIKRDKNCIRLAFLHGQSFDIKIDEL